MLPLFDTEFFSVKNLHAHHDLAYWLREGSDNSNKDLARRPHERPEYLNWVCSEDGLICPTASGGARGARPIGRYLLMDKSDVFLNRIEQEISRAKSGLANPKVNVHIFSGLSGGTGSGTFLDVCYMVRSIARRMGA